MLDDRGHVLYVGKARNLKKRVEAYTRTDQMPTRLQHMVGQTAALEVITTHTEVEALLLESNLIKRLKPRYNILLRDDKSFPHVLITTGHAWPRLAKHRGARTLKGEYFGPFASAGAVNQALSALQRAFLLRSCPDGVCLPAAPVPASCTRSNGVPRRVSAASTRRPISIWSKRRGPFCRAVPATCNGISARRMEEAATRLDYEVAAVFRDRIRALSALQTHQDINLLHLDDVDVIALYQAGGQSCLQVFFCRGGHNYGNSAYFPTQAREEDASAVLAAFIGQFYDDKIPPPEVLISHPLPEQTLIAAALTMKADRKVQIREAQRGDRRRLMDLALRNALEALGRRLAESDTQRRLLEAMAHTFRLEVASERIEVYDNSHVFGSHAVGVMIVAGREGFVKNAYRHFNIKGTPGDDYAMIREVLARRFHRSLQDEVGCNESWPNLVLIDGGRGQLNAALAALATLDLPGDSAVTVVAIAKGPDRHAGCETFHLSGRAPFTLSPNDPVLYFMQRLRDEAHRFAIASHRVRRSLALSLSPLDEIGGIGARRKKALLHHFGSARAVAEAALADLEAAAGISRTLAKKIYDHFHVNG